MFEPQLSYFEYVYEDLINDRGTREEVVRNAIWNFKEFNNRDVTPEECELYIDKSPLEMKTIWNKDFKYRDGFGMCYDENWKLVGYIGFDIEAISRKFKVIVITKKRSFEEFQREMMLREIKLQLEEGNQNVDY